MIQDLVEWTLNPSLITIFTAPDPPKFLSTLTGRAEVSGVLSVFLSFVHHHAESIQQGAVRERQHVFDQLARKFRRDMNVGSAVRAKQKQLDFLRSQASVSDYFRKAQASVARNSPLKVSAHAFLQRCVIAVRRYPFVKRYAENIMRQFREAGYRSPSWVAMEHLPATPSRQDPTAGELNTFMDLLHSFYLTDASFERSQVCQNLTLEALLCAMNSDGLLLSCDVKSSSSFTFTGAQLNHWMQFLLVYGFAFARSLLVFMADEDKPRRPPTLTTVQEEKLLEYWSGASRLRTTG